MSSPEYDVDDDLDDEDPFYAEERAREIEEAREEERQQTSYLLGGESNTTRGVVPDEVIEAERWAQRAARRGLALDIEATAALVLALWERQAYDWDRAPLWQRREYAWADRIRLSGRPDPRDDDNPF